ARRRRPRHRRAGQHLGGLDPPRPRPADPRRRGQERGPRTADRLRRRAGLRRPGREAALTAGPARPIQSRTNRKTQPEEEGATMATTTDIQADLATIVEEVAGVPAS